MSRPWILLSLALCGTQAGCSSPLKEFKCQVNSDCENAGVQGLCENNNLCSFLDSDCDSGRRYGAESGKLSGECVDKEGQDATVDASPATQQFDASVEIADAGEIDAEPTLAVDAGIDADLGTSVIRVEVESFQGNALFGDAICLVFDTDTGTYSPAYQCNIGEVECYWELPNQTQVKVIFDPPQDFDRAFTNCTNSCDEVDCDFIVSQDCDMSVIFD